MKYSAELSFLQKVIKKCRVQSRTVDPSRPVDERVDMGIRQFLSGGNKRSESFYDLLPSLTHNIIYKMTDELSTNYMFFLLPGCERESLFVIGPYVSCEISKGEIMEIAERLKISPRRVTQLETYFGSVPYIPDGSVLFAALDAFAELIWGGAHCFTVVDIEKDAQDSSLNISSADDVSDTSKTLLNMQIMEERYAYENEMMQAVSHGQIHKAEMFLSGFGPISFEQRLSDPLRNLKNYCIIMNTLLRKAAENGGVHPVYLDKLSSSFAQKIELMTSTEEIEGMMGEMFRSYCQLVKKHSTKNYSPPVQKAVLYIDTDITADLSLSTLAAIQNVSPSYLSALFRQETGKTLTDYVNEKRIKRAKRLLKTTKLQIQTVAQHCGIFDVQYFSRLFKKYEKKTPKEYRESPAQ